MFVVSWPLACKGSGDGAASRGESQQVMPPRTTANPSPGAVVNPSQCLPHSFADLAARIDPAVAQVKTKQERVADSGSRRIVGEGLGSAFVYDAQGLLLTNYHVVESATEIRVVLGDRRELPAQVIGADRLTDVALLRVAEKGLPALALGDSDALRVGDWVVAVGNPFGLSHTVSAGIISAKGRTGRDLEDLGDASGYYDFVQTDASINPGNSGGPLVDLEGRVVGINTAVRAQANNIGFAIPVNMVRELLPALLAEGRIRRSALGVRADTVTVDDVSRLRLPDSSGAIIRQVQAGTGAERAGLREDDVVLSFKGEKIAGPERLRWVASMAGVGRRVAVQVLRGNRRLDVQVTLGELKLPN